jgi:hypothetical protein
LPVKLSFLPAIWGPKHKTYFFFDTEFLRSLGGATRPLYSIPSLPERTGDFSDLGAPIYDPKSGSVVNGVITRSVFPGNQIPASEQSALALQWMKYLPQDHYLFKIDHYWGESDHLYFTIWRQITHPNDQCALPVQLCTSNPANPEDAWVSRFNWDHIFRPTLLSHFAFGYLNRNEGYGSVPGQNAADLPMIPNAAAYNASPAANFSGNGVSTFASWGNTSGPGPLNKTTRPSYITNELVTWVKGAHTIKMGGEYRHLAQVFRVNGNQSGTVNFTALNTGLPGVASGDPFASLMVGAVDNGNLNVYNVNKYGALQHAFALHIGDTWKMNSRLTLNYGLRWDKFTPTSETGDKLAFLSFAANPGAGGLPGSLAYAGSNWGAASYGAPYPEVPFNGGFGPRFGAAYRLDNQTVIRAGYGVFYTQAFYPSWGGGMNLDGFNPSLNFAGSLSGYVPGFYLDSGFPAYNSSPDISATADNGKSPQYRPPYANHLSYTQQWNLTVERKIGNSAVASVAYVANKGTHLPSQMQPLNYLNPSLLTSMGSTELNTVFQPGQTSLYGVNVPYTGWIDQLNNAGQCAPTVAQALVKYPQFCGGLTGLNENQGTSMYNSFQAKIEKQFANGFYAGANYTYSHLTTDASSTTQATAGYGGIGGVINPYQGSRNYSLSLDDQPNMFSVLGVYDLPFGRGKRYLNNGGWINALVGDWTLSTSMKFTSGIPLYFRDSTQCGVPGQFQAQCIPGISGNVLTQSWSGFNVNQPAYNAGAFETSSMFADGNYLGTGPRVSDVRASPYRDVNLSISKSISFKEKYKIEIRAEAFNAFNNHYFTCDGQAFGDCIPFNNDPSSKQFGAWNGTVSQPRNIQLVGRFTF